VVGTAFAALPKRGAPDAGAVLRGPHPVVCFGISFPAMALFGEWLYLRTGDELYRTLARCVFDVHPGFAAAVPLESDGCDTASGRQTGDR
jgi:hypothetical protein